MLYATHTDARCRCPRELLEKLAEDAIRSAQPPLTHVQTMCRPIHKRHSRCVGPTVSPAHAHQSSRAGEGRVGPVRVIRHAVRHVHRPVRFTVGVLCPRMQSAAHTTRRVMMCSRSFALPRIMNNIVQVARQPLQRQRASRHQMCQRHCRRCALRFNSVATQSH